VLVWKTGLIPTVALVVAPATIVVSAENVILLPNLKNLLKSK